ncbi:MAG: right-handed parallel beta-helix repeat-containing protein [Thermoplasmata archaeon]|nr:right-handed parallel beta-helix repeat-containing protein [Thermoplasmata archaeon]
MTSKKVSLIVILLVVAGSFYFALTDLPETVKGTTLFVGGAGPGNYTSIQEAIDDSISGDTVYVYNGTYYESLDVDKPLSLEGEGRDVTVIDTNSSGMGMRITADWVSVTGFTIMDSILGIRLDTVQNSRIMDNNLSNPERFDIWIESSRYSEIANNVMAAGLYMEGDLLAHWNTHIIDTSNTINGKPIRYIKNVTGGTVPAGAGQVILANCTGMVVEGQDVSDGYVGISVAFSSNIRIVNDTSSYNNLYGIFLYSSNSNTVVGNIALETQESGSNAATGIRLEHSSNNLVEGNHVEKSIRGIELWHSSNNTISNNDASDTYGIVLRYSDNNTITNNNVSSIANGGISLDTSNNNTIRFNDVSVGKGLAVGLGSSNDNIFADNTLAALAGAKKGIRIVQSNNNTIANNTISSHGEYGIELKESTNITITNNTMVEDGIYIRASDFLEHWNSHIIDSFNTVNGKPVYYWKNITGGLVPLNAGQVILVNCTGVRVENQDVSNGDAGVLLGFSSHSTLANITALSSDINGITLHDSSNNTITNVTASGAYNGIDLDLSNDNDINNNTATSSDYGIFIGRSNDNLLAFNEVHLNYDDGIRISRSYNNTLAYNTVTSNGGDGINLGASFFNTLAYNRISDNDAGIWMHFGNNIAYSNTVFSNREVGIGVWDDVHRIFHNKIVDNADQARDDFSKSQWDDGYPSGGNYWSDYLGVDQFSGPNQDIPGGDGIGDTPYVIDAASMDRYPLMNLSGFLPARAPIVLDAVLSGSNLEDVIVSWALSPDDGRGFESVVGYELFRSTIHDSGGVGYGLVASFPNGTSQFTDSLAGEGNPSNYFYIVCSLDLYSNTTCAKDQAGKFTRPLSMGQNLISIPLIQSNKSIERILQTVKWDKAWVYDSSVHKWKWHMTFKPYPSELETANHSIGLWIDVTEDSNLTVAGMVPTQTAINLYEGWNLIGFPSLLDSYDVASIRASLPVTFIEGFDSNSPYCLRKMMDTDVLQPGFGYWIFVGNMDVWIVENS